MKRILIHLLLLSTLFSGLAFAWDTHPEAVVGHDSVALNLLDNADHHDSETHHSDHCCHANAHLLAMIFNPVAASQTHHDTHLNNLFPALTRRYIAPLLRPPIS